MRALKTALALCTLGVLTACTFNIAAPEASASGAGSQGSGPYGSGSAGSGSAGAEDSAPLPTDGANPSTSPDDPPVSGEQFDIEGKDAAAVGERRIYQNSSKFRDLETSGMLEPGARYRTWHEDGSGPGSWGSCSFGWFVGTNTQIYNLTAGHCGEVGDAVYVHTSGRDPVYVGEFVHSDFDDAKISSGPDYGLIQIESRYFDNVVTNPRVSMSGEPVEIRGYADASWLSANQPYMCRLGFRTGLSCGSYEEITDEYTVTFANITDHGDSGGVIWAFDPNDSSQKNIYAIAVNSYTSEYDATTVGGKLIEPVMTDFDLTIFN